MSRVITNVIFWATIGILFEVFCNIHLTWIRKSGITFFVITFSISRKTEKSQKTVQKTLELLKVHGNLKTKLLKAMHYRHTQPTFTCSKLTIETLEQGAKYVLSWQ